MKRRDFLAGTAAGPMLMAAGGAAAAGGDAAKREVRLERLHPREIERAMQECATLFQPLGTIEWHGLHNIVGLDALKAQHLCVRAAQRGGGLVAPPLFGGVGGLNQPHTFVMEPEDNPHSWLVRGWVEQLCREAVRQGFRAVILLTGHYGAAQQIVVRDLAVRLSRMLATPILGTPEYFLALDEGYKGDHAAWGETSLMMELDPDSVDPARLGEPPHQGVGGRDPREATRSDGARLAATIVERLARLARAMPGWNGETLQGFIAAEAALVERQVWLAATEKKMWAGWRRIGQGALADYGRLLAEGQFDAIREQAAGL